MKYMYARMRVMSIFFTAPDKKKNCSVPVSNDNSTVSLKESAVKMYCAPSLALSTDNDNQGPQQTLEARSWNCPQIISLPEAPSFTS